jgi:transposase
MTFDEQAASLKHEDIVALLVSRQQLAESHNELTVRYADLKRQLEWLKRQMFGTKSERRLVDADGRQLSLGESLPAPATGPEVTVAEYRRRLRPRRETPEDEEALRFDESVPVEEIRLPAPAVDAEHEVVGEKVTLKLAQRPASYVVLKYIRPVVKRKDDGSLSCAPAPASVLGKSLADVSLLAGLILDKFRFHLPLYRQHQRMAAAGIRVARSTLTGLVHRTGDLLEPIYEAQLASVLASRVKTMDETPIRAGSKGHGRMKTGYF